MIVANLSQSQYTCKCRRPVRAVHVNLTPLISRGTLATVALAGQYFYPNAVLKPKQSV